MTLSKIAHLTAKEKQWYLQKMYTLSFNPYLLSNQLLTPLQSAKNLPNLTFAEIYIYLVHSPSPYTGEALKAFKSTEPYHYFTSGWVKDAKLHHVEAKKMFVEAKTVKVSDSLLMNSISFELPVMHRIHLCNVNENNGSSVLAFSLLL